MSISVGAVGLSGFRLVARRPVTALVWSVVALVWLVAAVLAAFAAGGGLASLQSGDVKPTNFGLFYLILIPLTLLGAAVIYCAVYRSVLRPDKRAFAYLRLGGDELRMVGLFWLMGLIGLMALLGLVMVMTMANLIVGGIFSAFAGEAARVVVGFLTGLAFLGVMIWMVVRISFAAPMTFATRRIQLGKAWEMTEGRFWPLFGAYLLSWVLAFFMLMASGFLGNLLMGAVVGAGGGAGVVALIAGFVIYFALQLVTFGPSYAVLGAPAANAYNQFAPRRDIAETFA